jgi:hypothetical protein
MAIDDTILLPRHTVSQFVPLSGRTATFMHAQPDNDAQCDNSRSSIVSVALNRAWRKWVKCTAAFGLSFGLLALKRATCQRSFQDAPYAIDLTARNALPLGVEYACACHAYMSSHFAYSLPERSRQNNTGINVPSLLKE